MAQSPLIQHSLIYPSGSQGKYDSENNMADLLINERRSVSTVNNPMIRDKDDDFTSRLLSASSFSRRFSFVNPSNSAKLTTFLLLNSMIGSGILNQPFVFRESGILGGVS